MSKENASLRQILSTQVRFFAEDKITSYSLTLATGNELEPIHVAWPRGREVRRASPEPKLLGLNSRPETKHQSRRSSRVSSAGGSWEIPRRLQAPLGIIALLFNSQSLQKEHVTAVGRFSTEQGESDLCDRYEATGDLLALQHEGLSAGNDERACDFIRKEEPQESRDPDAPPCRRAPTPCS